jgi:hypothetical protein
MLHSLMTSGVSSTRFDQRRGSYDPCAVSLFQADARAFAGASATDGLPTSNSEASLGEILGPNFTVPGGLPGGGASVLREFQ